MTQKSSFFGDIHYFKWMTAYVPLLLVSLAWTATQAVAVWNNVWGEYPMDHNRSILDKFPMASFTTEALTFFYMIWPTVLVSAHNFL